MTTPWPAASTSWTSMKVFRSICRSLRSSFIQITSRRQTVLTWQFTRYSQFWMNLIDKSFNHKVFTFALLYLMIAIFLFIDAQSFSNSFEVVHGVVRKSGRGSSIFVFYCIFMLQFFKVFWGGTWGCEKIWEWVLYFRVLLHFYATIFQSLLRGCPLSPPAPPAPPVCIYVLIPRQPFFETGFEFVIFFSCKNQWSSYLLLNSNLYSTVYC